MCDPFSRKNVIEYDDIIIPGKKCCLKLISGTFIVINYHLVVEQSH